VACRSSIDTSFAGGSLYTHVKASKAFSNPYSG
jgi:hypothetical protein